MTSETRQARARQSGSPPAGELGADDLKRFSATETRLLLGQSADWIWETDADLRFSWFSSNYQHLTGLNPAEVIGRSRGDLMKQVSLASRSVVSNQSDMEARLSFHDFVYELKAAHSACRWVSILGAPRFDAAGKFLGYRGIGRNVTRLATAIDDLQARYASDMKAREAELEQALREARESMRQTELYRHVLNELPVSVFVKSEALAFGVRQQGGATFRVFPAKMRWARPTAISSGPRARGSPSATARY